MGGGGGGRHMPEGGRGAWVPRPLHLSLRAGAPLPALSEGGRSPSISACLHVRPDHTMGDNSRGDHSRVALPPQG
jgi:hypothetical protein